LAGGAYSGKQKDKCKNVVEKGMGSFGKSVREGEYEGRVKRGNLIHGREGLEGKRNFDSIEGGFLPSWKNRSAYKI